ncbi:MAG: valyl-tRNA synthetase [Parcubacteria group bacterium Gr01-1014_56]|nr:MAG: valyl-tRNA synthetase [Parcubacteria group bacterium Gr01-1014_56]
MPEKFKKPYDHTAVEAAVYKKWEESGYFNPDNLPGERKEVYSIIMPPPNANGSLHVGHALFVTLQDLFIRYKRMSGFKTLWLPGADHAGFETQLVYEKKLEKEGRSRFKMDRDEFYKETLAFTQTNKVFMESQLRQLGASCDWSREKFTLDPDIIKTVYGTFEQLYKDGLAYRGVRPVNWSTKYQTSLSDLETKTIERKDPLYYLKYGPFVLATVRPETKFGDTAVAVNPNDKRYQEWVGKEIEFDGLIGPVKLRVIADEYVDMEFGTGVVKITPAHDPNDFEVAQRHGLPAVEVIDKYGRLTEKCGKYAGMKVMEARAAVAKDLAEKGLLEKVDENYTHTILVNYKNENDILEPRIMPQWFIKMQPLAEKAREAVEQGKIKFVTDYHQKIFFHWLDNLRDWNISRQIIWGIPIPAWYCLKCKKPQINFKIKSKWFLIRHGLTELNVKELLQGMSDSKLTPEGIAQAKAAGERLKNQGIAMIISSDLGRCKETSEIIAEAIGASIVYDEILRERDFRSLEKTSYKDFMEKQTVPGVRNYDIRLADEETYQEVEERVWGAFTKHQAEHGGKNILIVSHGAVTRALLKKIKDLTPGDAMSTPAVENGEIFALEVSEDPCSQCGGDLFEHDSDTFDTWFSSGQWPFATLGYPDSSDFKTYYPTNVMETGYDILFFWVMRMIMLGLYRTGEVPFRDVYLHGLIRDANKQKMSKSKGNVINPLDVASVYGTDALRMALLVGNTPGADMSLAEDKIKAYKLFSNKLWNIARFVLDGTDGTVPGALNEADQKLRDECDALIVDVTEDLNKYRVYMAAEKLYHYIWDRLAAEILEESKPLLKGSDAAAKSSRQTLLLSLLSDSLKLLHPFMPFVTEEIWGSMPGTRDLLMVEAWPSKASE